ncbi:MAG: MATE family efflux transporter [Acidobacteriota bacterium]
MSSAPPQSDPSRAPRLRASILALAVPASLEAVFQMSFGFLDQVVIGHLGEAPLAAVGLTSQLMFLSTLVLGGIAAGTAILVAQFHGKGDSIGVTRSTGASLLLAALVAVPLAVAVVAAPRRLLALLGTEATVIDAGAGYFQLVMATLPLALLGTVVVGALRSLGDAKTPMFVTFGTMGANTVLNVVLVFGLGPLPAFGLAGAAAATVASQVLRLAVLAVLLARRREIDPAALVRIATAERRMVRRLTELSLPIAGANGLWALGAFVYTVTCVQLGTVAMVANQLVLATEAIFIMFSSGFGVAALTLVGQSVGVGDFARVKTQTRALVRIGLQSAVFFGLLLAGAAFLVPVAYPEVSAETLRWVTLGLILNAFVQPAKVLNMILSNGVLRAAGDTRMLMLIDVVAIYGVGVPVALLLALPLELGILGIFLGRAAEEVSRTLILWLRYRTPSWQRVVVADSPA